MKERSVQRREAMDRERRFGRRKFLARCFALVLLAFVLLAARHPAIAAAESVTGCAAISGGDVEKARRMARQDAMRIYAEQQVGVYVDSRTETELGMVVSDRVSTEAQGYVKVKRIVKEWSAGELYYMTLDMEAGALPIASAVEEVRAQLMMLPDSATRKGVQVAVSGWNGAGTARDMARMNQYVRTKLQANMEDLGFLVMVSDDVLAYMSHHPDMADPAASAEVRRIARNTRGAEDALLRGTLTVVDTRRTGGAYIAAVNASFELVGLADNRVNSFSDYFTAVGKTQQEAEGKAMNLAAREATEALGRKVVELIQQSGFRRGIQVPVVFAGIYDRNAQENLILQGIEAANCQVINSSFTSAGEYKVFLKSTAYPSLHELRRALLQHIPGLVTADDRESELGGQKLYFSF